MGTCFKKLNMEKAIKETPKTTTREITTNPGIGGMRLKEAKVLKNLIPYGYACNVGETYVFPGHVYDLFKENGLVE